MKLSFVISLHNTRFKSIAQGDWKENMALMHNLGFQGVELAIKDPKTINVEELKIELRKYKLFPVAIGTGQAYVDERISLTDDREFIRRKAIERLKNHTDLASVLGCQIIIGLIRGNLGKHGIKRKIKNNYLMNAMSEIARYACKKRVLITIEPLNRYESDCLNKAKDVINLIQQLKFPNLKILLDTFHMNIEETDICNTIILSQPFLSHFHVADSNRRCPGEGHLDFFKIIKALKAIKYTGFLSGEMLPLPDLQTAMKNYCNSIRELINE